MSASLSAPELARKIEAVSRSLLGAIPRNHAAYDWAIDLCGLIGQTVACGKCGGRGTRERRPNCSHSSHGCYGYGCYEQIECRACLGCGRLPKVPALDAKGPE